MTDTIEDTDYNTELFPQFSLTIVDDADGIELGVSLPTISDDRPASLGLLFGLAIMSLNQDGTIERRMEELIAGQAPITQKVAVDSIQLLLKEDYNDQIL